MANWDRFGFLGGLSALVIAAAALANCGPAASTSAGSKAGAQPGPAGATSAASGAGQGSSATKPAAAQKPFDPCEGSEPVPHPYFGLLSEARCDQDMYLRMAGIASQLGVECSYCHQPSAADPKKEDYPPMTPRKEIANWMREHLMESLRSADGSPITCKSCHTDDKGKPIAKIFGSPRDPMKAQEWMTLVMVNKFVTKSGERLKCKSCHVGNYSTPTFQAKVILRSGQLPPH